MNDNFKLYKKWFWVGIAVGFLNILAGLIYGIALIVEPEHRKEGLIIIIWTLISFALLFFLAANLQEAGLMPPQL